MDKAIPVFSPLFFEFQRKYAVSVIRLCSGIPSSFKHKHTGCGPNFATKTNTNKAQFLLSKTGRFCHVGDSWKLYSLSYVAEHHKLTWSNFHSTAACLIKVRWLNVLNGIAHFIKASITQESRSCLSRLSSIKKSNKIKEL